MKLLQLLAFTFLLAQTLFIAIEGHADSNRPSINANGMVRTVYFLPNDRPTRPDRVAALRQLIKDAQQFYADEMDRHGFGRKTFTIETDEDGEPTVHQINGKFREEYYYKENLADFAVWGELLEHFDGADLQHVYFIAIDLSYESLGGLGGAIFYPTQGDIGFGPAGKAKLRHRHITMGEELLGGFALISAPAGFERLGVTVHELGHAFALVHDFRKGPGSDYVMAGAEQKRLSKCAAEWLSFSRFFNTKSIFHNEPGEIQLLSPRTYGQDTINFRFKVTDPDGLHQAQLLVPEILPDPRWAGWGPNRLFDCKRLNGKTDTVESVVRTAEIVDRIALQIIDVGGNITWATFPIQLEDVVSAQNALDVNSDGVVNLLDLTPFVSGFGQRGKDSADVNGDGVVDIVDVLLVVGSSSSVSRQAAETFTAADVQKWLTDAKQLGVENAILQKGLVGLEHLLAEIALLSTPMEVATGPLEAIFLGHTDPVWSVAFSPDGGTLASGSFDNTIRLWDTHSAQHKFTLIGETGHIGSVAFSPDGETLASASWDRTIRLWDPHTGELKRTLNYTSSVTSVAFSPDGQTLASGSADQTIRLWDTTTWQVERILMDHTHVVDSVVFSPNGATLASGSRDKTIRLWNPNTGKLLHTLTEHRSEVNRLAFSLDGATLASGSWDKTIRLWNPNTGKLKRTLPNQTGESGPVAFSPDGGTLAIGNRGISLWDTEAGQYIKPLARDIGGVISVVFSLDGTMLASGSADKKVRLWEFTPFLKMPGLSKISGDNQKGVSGGVLANPFVIKVRDENLSALEGISVTFTVAAGDGTLSVTHTTTDENGRAESTLTLGPNLGTNAVSVSAAGIQGAVAFSAVAEAAVDISDTNLRAAIEATLGKAVREPIAPSVLAVLTHLEAPEAGVRVLTGLEAATNLTSLNLGGNSVSDISSIAGLTKLTRLTLWGNSISDISSVSGLTNLTSLSLWDNNVSDISAVAGLTNLTGLHLGGNKVSDISPVAGLTRLTALHLPGNNISDASVVAGLTRLTYLNLSGTDITDLSFLSGLTNLKTLRLEYNSISDLSPLVANTGLGSGDTVYVQENRLSYQSIHTHIPTLQSRGVTVEFDNRISTPPLKISGDDQRSTPSSVLKEPLVVKVQDGSSVPFEGVPVTFTVTAGGGTLSATSVTTDSNGRAESTLTLGPNPGTNTVTVSVTGSQEKRTFNAEGSRIPKKLEIISGVDQEGLPGEALEKPFVVEVRDQTDTPLAGVEVTFTVTVTAGDGTLSEISVTTDSNGRAESILTLGPNPGTNTVEATVTGIEEKRTFNAEGIRIPKTLEIISGVDQEGLPGDALEKAFVVEVRDQTDKPLPGVAVTFTVTAGGGKVQPEIATTDENGRAESTLTLGSTPGTNTVRVSVEGNTQAVATLTIETVRVFALSIPAGTHLIHIPLAVNQINGEDATIETVGDLYNALGEAVNYIITVGDDGGWKTYLGDLSAGSAADAAIGDDTGLVVVMSDAKTLELVGDALGTDGASMINIDVGNNLVGLPLKPAAGLSMISDLLGDGVGAIAVSKADGMGFHTIREPGQDGDGPIVGGVGYLVVYIGTEATSIPIVGSAWENSGAVSAAPAVAFDGSQTPVLYVEGGVMDEFNMLARAPELRVTVKNLSTGASLDTVLGTELSATAYSGTFVELSRHAAKAGDVLEIVAHSPNPFVGVRPVPQIVVSAEQVLTSRISLPDLELYEIPSDTELLANYPNPFNPETWIPYQLAEDADVTLTIYDTKGVTVRRLDLGHQLAGYYADRGKAAYWDGRNDNGESVASGLYFYQLGTPSFSHVRRMVILK